ncbi:GNAT family N-acetyltransferase [Paenibacillus sp. MBLB4367]|uniref:GNAT family N-acetyltransferase n=1 Tax=Paenibacillus sp. MBLB4367 TaxID=3384767 RepID=UPI0039081E6F
MGIRRAKVEDWREISELMDQLGYPDTKSFMPGRIKQLIELPDEELLVYELEGKAVAVLSIHFIPQLALEGDFARISYFSVDHRIRSKGIGKELEQFCVKLASERHCDRIEVHCHSGRTDAHRFYFRQNFEESPKYLIKKL